jgi:hypothetical protein
VVPHSAGGETSAAGGQGLCEACNYAKQAPGWRARPSPTSTLGDHEVETTTPTGHTYRSKAPPLPGAKTNADVPPVTWLSFRPGVWTAIYHDLDEAS